ncbi:MAG: hypothetical protein EPN65_10205 [Pandoraea sp.]|uniref:tripartite tricarboxylate transporter substrate-binding protein n=1 Tax=Pandoraea sp. TaxID=1883445 RepID=UPI001200E94B|nr:tripartite tricarboxylate transporter substrate-binding protein [Pandoraea sp.]TAM17559.1 MAG: hypothetical protein EPN65_10205 [Pandoraea sp.]
MSDEEKLFIDKKGRQIRLIWDDSQTVCTAYHGEKKVGGFQCWAVGTTQWYGVAAPKGTPPDVVATLNQHIQTILKQPDVVKQLTMNGAVLTNTSGDEFTKFIETYIADYRGAVKPFNH